jgi:hypothetical protein
MRAVVAHVNIARFLEILCGIQEKTTCSLIIAKSGNFDTARKNYEKEYKLIEAMKNYDVLTFDAFYELISSIYHWRTINE